MTPYIIVKNYPIPFGGGTLTINLLLAKDGRLFIATANTKHVDVGKLKQPKGYPLMPNERTAEKKTGQKRAGKKAQGKE